MRIELTPFPDARRRTRVPQPDGPNQVWAIHSVDVTTANEDTWRVTGIADCWSQYEFPWRIAPAWDRASPEAALAVAIIEAEHLAQARLADLLRRGPGVGHRTIKVVVHRAGRVRRKFARYVTSFPEFDLIRVSPREWMRAGGLVMLGSERLQGEQPANGDELAAIARQYRIQFNTTRPHELVKHTQPLRAHVLGSPLR